MEQNPYQQFQALQENIRTLVDKITTRLQPDENRAAGMSQNAVNAIQQLERAINQSRTGFDKARNYLTEQRDALKRSIQAVEQELQTTRASAAITIIPPEIIRDLESKKNALSSTLSTTNDNLKKLNESGVEPTIEGLKSLQDQIEKNDAAMRRSRWIREVVTNMLFLFAIELGNVNRILRSAGYGWMSSFKETARVVRDSITSIFTGSFMTIPQEAKMRASFAQEQLLTGTQAAGLGLREIIGSAVQRGGVAPEVATQVAYKAYQYGGYDQRYADQQMDMIARVAQASGAEFGSVLKEMQANMDLLANAANQVPGELARAVIEARRLGISLQTAEGFANRMTSDFETYLTAQAELQTVMPGMDLTETLLASQYGSTQDVLESLQSAFGGQDIANLPRSIRQMISRATGLSEADLVKASGGQSKPEELQTATLAEAKLTNKILGEMPDKIGAIMGAAMKLIFALGAASFVRGFMNLGLRGGRDNVRRLLPTWLSFGRRRAGAADVSAMAGAGAKASRFAGLSKFGRALRLPGVGALMGGLAGYFEARKENKDRQTALGTGVVTGAGALVGGAALSFLGPIGVAIGAFIGEKLGKTVAEKFPTLTKIAGSALEELGASIANVWNIIKGLFGKEGSLGKALENLKPVFEVLATAVIPPLVLAVTTLTDALTIFFKIIGFGFKIVGKVIEVGSSIVGSLFTRQDLTQSATYGLRGIEGRDIISTPKEQRTLLDGNSAISLDSRDTVVAGTKLFGEGMLRMQQPMPSYDFARLEQKLESIVSAISSMGIVVELDGRKVGTGVVAAFSRG